ncbi:MAG: flavodoxin family protein [Methanomicrobiales archaeon]|nr:flavodoxin family protein [Methanomicrobiales archaeon]
MEQDRELLITKTISGTGIVYELTLHREDFSACYPGMQRYVVEAAAQGQEPARFITNTYEYSPLLPGSAESAARQVFAVWEVGLITDPAAIFREYASRPHPAMPEEVDLLILQGSPRPDGNCAILSEWALEAAREAGRTSRVIYPHDLDIHPCIGCYQCYNMGTCVYRDDMDEIIAAVRGARLIIACSPVYSNTVPAGLKLVIDRMQAYHAERALGGEGRPGLKALMYSVAGRRGRENFTCVTKVLAAFFHTIGAVPAGEVLIDSADSIRDIRTIKGEEEAVKAQVKRHLRG